MEDKKRNGFFEKELVVFILGPLLLIVMVVFTGYQIFYNGADRAKENSLATIGRSSILPNRYRVNIVLFQ